MGETEADLPRGPVPGVNYPIKVSILVPRLNKFYIFIIMILRLALLVEEVVVIIEFGLLQVIDLLYSDIRREAISRDYFSLSVCYCLSIYNLRC